MLEFIKVREEHLELILNWRTLPEVTRYMFTDVENNIENQQKWYKKILTDKSSRYWMISYQDNYIGVISLTDIDYNNKHCTWGYYIGETPYRSLGGLIPPYLYNYVFHEMKFNKIIAQVMEGNENIMKLHKIHGYRLVGRHENHIYKYNKYHDIFTYELLHKTWKSMNRYKKFVVNFEE